MKKTWIFLLILALLLAACGDSAVEPVVDENGGGETAVTEPETAPAEEPVEPAEAPAEEPEPAAGGQTLILATTTSTENSGLLAYILPVFEEMYDVSVDVVAVGTGQALQLGEDGNADVLLVHARALEDAFMEAGHGSRREDVMYNDFVILGPSDDPAGIMGKNKASRAFELIAEAGAPFVSRGDDSGTHTKEKAVWTEAGVEPAGDWYISAGQGMGAVLTMAGEQQAYTLSDRATYLARTLEGINLDVMVEGDPILFHPYGVIAVNPDKGDHIQADLANQFIDWLTSLTTQELIAQVGVEEFGAPLFTPDSTAWREAGGAVETEPAEAAEPQTLILATTTSTQDSGLLDAILPVFEESFNVSVDVIAVGTGQAIQLGEDGNADVILVHARAREDAFMEAGHGSRREDVMYNDFVILGPTDDPAGILGKNKADRAFQLIAEAEAPFVSRGDDSGTHTKELSIWQAAGIEPAGDWYISAGQGMGAVLTMANEQQAYTLSDRATYLARTLEGTDLEIMVEGDPILFNPYGVIAVNPDKGEHIQADLANLFIDWLISVPTQELIGEFGTAEFGSPLFTPDSAEWQAAMGGETGGTEMTDADLRVTGLVDNEMGWSEAEMRAMETMDAEGVNNSGETETYTGVSINALLEMAGVKNRATAVTLLDADGNSIELPLADLQACTDCILSFRNQGGFSTTLPDFPDMDRLRGVVEIQVK